MADTPYPPMRRKDRAMTDPAQLRRLLEQCQVMRLAMTGPQGPYVVPLNFGYALEPNGRLQLFFHCAAQGRKIRLLEADPRVCFEMDCQYPLRIFPWLCQHHRLRPGKGAAYARGTGGRPLPDYGPVRQGPLCL